ncbi:MAG: glutamate-cysteine ligase family protein [Alphaproteobacteria bacterium]|nr:glutamate-cysteine ligase family protein [Alphaproteobacteria bacterium]
MTDVQKNNTRLIASIDDARALYAPPPEKFTGKMGVEVEMPLIDARRGKPEVPTALEMEKLQAVLRKKGFDAQLEPAGVLEYASPATTPDAPAVSRLVSILREELATFTKAAEEAGFTRVPFSIVPTTTEQDALDKIVSRPRLQVSIGAMKEIFPPDTLRLPLLTSAVQVSFSPKDENEMFDMARRAYALTPLLMAACNTLSGYVVNEDEKLGILPRAQYYQGYGRAGGLSEAFLKATNGKEFIDGHIREVFDAPMHFAYDKDGNLFPASREKPITFAGLIAEGLNTQSNFELAETFLYNDIKICNLRDEAGTVVGKRMEVRGADSGIDQPVMAALLSAAIVPAGPQAKAFDALLADYGFTGNPVNDAPLLKSARAAVVGHGGKFMDVAFGKDPQTGAVRSLRDFAADVAGIVATRYEAQPELAADVSRLVNVLLTGDCDAKLFSQKFGTLKDASDYMLAQAKPQNKPAIPPALRRAMGK